MEFQNSSWTIYAVQQQQQQQQQQQGMLCYPGFSATAQLTTDLMTLVSSPEAISGSSESMVSDISGLRQMFETSCKSRNLVLPSGADQGESGEAMLTQ